MLNIDVELSGFDEFITKLGILKGSPLISSGVKKFVNHVRDVVIEGTPIGDEETDEHPGLMKKSWEQPRYAVSNDSLTATITNSVDYGMASNYGHTQTPGVYVPAINARLVHSWVPGTYALETSLDKAEIDFESIIKPKILKVWNETRTDYYDRPGEELNAGSTYESNQ